MFIRKINQFFSESFTSFSAKNTRVSAKKNSVFQQETLESQQKNSVFQQETLESQQKNSVFQQETLKSQQKNSETLISREITCFTEKILDNTHPKTINLVLLHAQTNLCPPPPPPPSPTFSHFFFTEIYQSLGRGGGPLDQPTHDIQDTVDRISKGGHGFSINLVTKSAKIKFGKNRF